MSNTAKKIIVPANGVFRIVSLYVGQGDATILIIPDGNTFKYILVDNNIDKSNGGINTTKLLKDLMDGVGKLDVFMNTHPHADHTEGIETINDEIGVKEIWHSGHNPGKDADEAYQEMKRVIKDIGKENEFRFFGTNDKNKIRKGDADTQVEKILGDVNYQVLSPAEYLVDEIAGEDPKDRRARIHEHCSVIRFSYGNPEKHFMITGDADRIAFEDNIVDYHESVLPCDILSGSHHGSRTFFKFRGNDDDVYEKHIEKMKPTYLVISAPKQSESSHDHPHDDAMDLYKKHIKEENIFHTGKKRESVIFDIHSNGTISVTLDTDLVDKYGYDNDGDDDKSGSSSAPYVGSRTTNLDSKPMGANE